MVLKNKIKGKKMKTFCNLKEKYVCVFLSRHFYTYVNQVAYKHLKHFIYSLLHCFHLKINCRCLFISVYIFTFYVYLFTGRNDSNNSCLRIIYSFIKLHKCTLQCIILKFTYGLNKYL